jgi:hypothetical protein
VRGPQTEVFKAAACHSCEGSTDRIFKAAACHSWSMVMLHTYDVPFPSCFLFYFYFYFWLFIYFLFLCADHPMAMFTIYINQRLTWAWYYSPVYSCPVCVQLILRKLYSYTWCELRMNIYNTCEKIKFWQMYQANLR